MKNNVFIPDLFQWKMPTLQVIVPLKLAYTHHIMIQGLFVRYFKYSGNKLAIRLAFDGFLYSSKMKKRKYLQQQDWLRQVLEITTIFSVVVSKG